MSNCKHEKRKDYASPPYGYVCYCLECEADISSFELEALERAERAEAELRDRAVVGYEDWEHEFNKVTDLEARIKRMADTFNLVYMMYPEYFNEMNFLYPLFNYGEAEP